MKSMFVVVLLLCLSVPAFAITTQLSTHVYQVTEGVEFTISNSGATSFLLSWSDGGGTFTDIEDPSLVLSEGQTYIFRRTTSVHPFVITDNSLPMTGTDGSFSRTTFDGAVIDAATLTPIADFTADPAPTTDFISWTPGPADLTNFFYTCRITSHAGMTGGIRVEAAGVPVKPGSWSSVKSLYVD